MENRAHALAAGIFTIVLALAAAFAIWWLSGKREEMREYVLVTRSSVTGLNVQAQVRYRGIRSGKVLDIGLDPDDPRNILVRVAVDADMPVTAATVAKLKYQGLTGLAYIQLEDEGDSREPLRGRDGQPPRIVLKGSAFDDIVEATLATMREVKKIAERADRILDEANVERVASALANIESASQRLDASLKETPEAVAALRRALNDENLKRLERTLANLEKASRDAGPLTAEARRLIASLDGLAQRLDGVAGEASGELVQGTLPKLNVLLEDLAANSRQLGKLLEELEGSPNMLIFGRSGRQPGPGEAGFQP
ncbi:MAG: MlaD family protein [Pseudomonadota bacterium]|jgi:phospholipid/cholesterol/gamma-HCH transport system substrate-binding protein